MKRIFTAVVAIPILVLIIEFAPPLVCVALIAIAALLALKEYFGLVGEQVPLVFRVAGFLVAVLILFAVTFHGYVAELPLFIFPAGVILMLTVALFSAGGETPAIRFQAAVLALFGAFYVGGLTAYLAAIRMISPDDGADFLMMLFCMIWAGDTFAYFFGRTLGKHKLAPTISPNKTVEGAVAGFVFSILIAIACRFVFVQQLTWIDATILGAIIGVMGQIGDLCESIIKRAVSVKDSGSILPGHGGMLDRIDSLLFGAPAMYYYFYFAIHR
jgi:phosphatidate cytidylyltransferase